MSRRRRSPLRFRTILRGAEGLEPGTHRVQIAAILPSIGPDGRGLTGVLDVVDPDPPLSTEPTLTKDKIR